MKYTKLIVSFLSLNLFLIFAMIFIANKTREIEKNNNNIQSATIKIKEELKINQLELITYKNSSYLAQLHRLYFSELTKKNIPNVLSINEFIEENKNIKLVKSDN